MAHAFEITKDIEVEASPEQVWEAVATGLGMDSWFMGRNDIEPRQDGRVRWSIGGFTAESTVSVWQPPERFVSTSDEGTDGSFHRFDYRIERNERGATIRYVHSGMLGGDWEAEYDAMSEGDPMYLHKLAQYLTFFSGRLATPVDTQGPQVGDRERVMATFRRGLGLGEDVAVGDRVHLTPDGLASIDGVVDYESPSFLGVRSEDALYRFICGFDGTVMVGHHLFSGGVDQRVEEDAWRVWLEQLFALAGGGGASQG